MEERHDQHRLQFRVLSDQEIEKLLEAVLDCLDRTGVHVLNAEARELLAAAGARVDGVRVRIPPSIMHEAIASCPHRFSLWGRDPRHRMDMVPGRVYFGPGPTCSYFMDPETGERRRARRQDVGLTARVSDALENIDYVMGLAWPEDVPPQRVPVFEFAEMVMNTGKPLMAWGFSLDNMQDIYRIAVAAAGSEGAFRARPFFALFTTALGPLVHTDAELANVFWCAERDIPIVYHGPAVAGVSAPITGAGTLVVSLAASLSGLAIIQLRKQGVPVCIGAVPSPLDPRTGRPSYGAPELSLYSAALAEVAHYLDLPFMGTAGASEAKALDLQAGIESTLQIVFSLLSGTTMPHDAGFLDCADIGSLEMLIMTDEIIGMVRRVMRGIEISDDTLMLDLIDQVGPAGEFLSHPETARRLRREVWIPHLMDRGPWVHWAELGFPTMQDRIQRRLREILQTHTPPPLPAGAAETIAAILEAAA